MGRRGPKEEGGRWQDLEDKEAGMSLAAQWLGLGAPTAGRAGLIPGQRDEILHVSWCGPLKMRKQSQVGERTGGQASPYLSLVVGVGGPFAG